MKNSVVIVYDKQCPACSSYCSFLRIKEDFGEIELVDARDDNEYTMGILDKGWNLDDGFVVIIENNFYCGSEAINILALISSKSSLFNRVNYLVFKNKVFAKVFYPGLKVFRMILLAVVGRKKIGNLNRDNQLR